MSLGSPALVSVNAGRVWKRETWFGGGAPWAGGGLRAAVCLLPPSCSVFHARAASVEAIGRPRYGSWLLGTISPARWCCWMPSLSEAARLFGTWVVGGHRLPAGEGLGGEEASRFRGWIPKKASASLPSNSCLCRQDLAVQRGRGKGFLVLLEENSQSVGCLNPL